MNGRIVLKQKKLLYVLCIQRTIPLIRSSEDPLRIPCQVSAPELGFLPYWCLLTFHIKYYSAFVNFFFIFLRSNIRVTPKIFSVGHPRRTIFQYLSAKRDTMETQLTYTYSVPNSVVFRLLEHVAFRSCIIIFVCITFFELQIVGNNREIKNITQGYLDTRVVLIGDVYTVACIHCSRKVKTLP